jgi:hypothetical protein
MTVTCIYCGIRFTVIDKPRPNAETAVCPERPCRRVFQHGHPGEKHGKREPVRMTVLRADVEEPDARA